MCADCGESLRIIRYRFKCPNELFVEYDLCCARCAIFRMKRGERCS